MLLNTAVKNRTQITIKAKKPLAVRLVRRVGIDYEHSVTIMAVNEYPPSRDLPSCRADGTSIHEVLKPTPSPQEIPAIPSPFIVRGPADAKAKQKERKSNTHPLALLLTLTMPSKGNNRGISEHGTIPQTPTGKRQPLWTTRAGLSTCPRLTARYCK